ncbi:DUF4383 domain-containing protein [Streptomyces sp. NPDC004111]|uniref:DUF4383 domain-containing protein n=1 Tax=Streptomyces sp. NPDC004111 TaxID=3364690 RepID=UPI0036BF972A
MKLKDELPVDHRLAKVYRSGAALCGLILLAFGCLGFANQLAFFDTNGESVAGMSTNGLLSLISVLVGLLLVGAAIVGGNFASNVNMTIGVLFLLSGFVHLFILDKPANFLDFRMSNVVFSFLMGLLIMTFGMYGRVSGGLPHDNPYWRSRHSQEAAAEDVRRRARVAAAGRTQALTSKVMPTTGHGGLPPAGGQPH